MLRGYGQNLTAAGRFEEAGQVPLEAHEIIDAYLGEDNFRMRRVKATLDELSRAPNGQFGSKTP
jgi:hypothetical protein